MCDSSENAMCAEAMIYLVTMLAAAAVGITGSVSPCPLLILDYLGISTCIYRKSSLK